ncbi:MAG: hypothetical protein IJK39_03925 [Bacteroidales bacterium]|nr:hypothetical protein [Bacteroidales bacterium]
MQGTIAEPLPSPCQEEVSEGLEDEDWGLEDEDWGLEEGGWSLEEEC